LIKKKCTEIHLNFTEVKKKKIITHEHLYILVDQWSGLDWIDLAQDRDQGRALVNTVLNLRVP
jgi:hypothetical protein